MGYAGYTELVEGNTVRRAPLESDLREEDVSSRLIRNRERTRQMNMAYVLFLTAAAVLCVAFCIIFLQLQTQSTQLQKKAASLQLQLKDLQMENDTVYNEIVSGVDLEKVSAAAKDVKNKLEWGFGVGGGVEIAGHLQLSVQWFKNLGTLYNDGKIDGEAVLTTFKDNYKNIENYTGVKVTLGILF